MTQCNHEAFSFSNCRKRQVKGNFFGEPVSSNGGSLLVREVDRRMGLTMAVARALGDQRQRGKVRHDVETMVRQRVHAIALGYEDLNDHDALREDLVVQTACERDGVLASSSTLCRFEQRAEPQWAIAIHQQLVEQFIASFAHRPRELVRLRRDRRPGARPSAGAVLPRVLRPVLLFAAVRVLRPAVAGRLPSALEHRCLETCLGNFVVVGQTVSTGMAGR